MRQTCDLAPDGWLCLRDPGHGGPCAAAPLVGKFCCPDIERCIERGCQCKCGPAHRITWRERLQRLIDKFL